MHTHSGALGGARGEIDGTEFYLTTDRVPAHEFDEILSQFRASQKGVSSAPADDLRIECRFPARFKFIRREVKEAKSWSMPVCPRFEHFRNGIQAQSVTLVFSAYYLNNPASAFGHTFLRLNKERQNGKRYPLLDYGLGFAATAPDVNPITFALGGMFGWFYGDFTSIPYYLKTQEYNDYESRDLWEYDLRLTPDEIELLVAHLWELANAKIHYQYLAKNCSSLMLTALEAAAPRLELTKKLPYWVIPADTVRVVNEVPDLVAGYRFRPSKRSQFFARYQKLSQKQKTGFIRLASEESFNLGTAQFDSAADLQILDTLIDYYDFRYYKKLLREENSFTDTKQRMLLARSRLGQGEDDFVVPEPEFEKPHAAHRSGRSAIGLMQTQLGARALTIGQRFALHDMLDAQVGYPRDSEILFLDFQLIALTQPAIGRSAESAIRVDRAYVFGVKSFAPFEKMVPNLSWKVRLGAESTWDASCYKCVAAVFGGGIGYTADVYAGRLFATLLLSPDFSISGEFDKSALKFRIGPEFNLRALLTRTLLLQFNAQYLHLFLTKPDDAYTMGEEVRWSLPSQNVALGASVNHLPGGEVESRAQIYFYW